MLAYKDVLKKIAQGNFLFIDNEGDNLLQSLIKNEEFDTIPLAPVLQILKHHPEFADIPDKKGLYPIQLLDNAQVKARKNRRLDDDDPGVPSNRPLRRLLAQYTTLTKQKEELEKGAFISFIEQINGTKNKEEKDAQVISNEEVEEKFKKPCLLIFPGVEGHNLIAIKSTGRIIRKALGIYNHKISDFSVLAVRCPGNEKDFANDYLRYHQTLSTEQWKEKIDDFILPFVHRYLRPFYLNQKKEKRSLESILKNVRNLNLIGYCRGAYIIQEIMDKMYQDLIKNGFTEEDAKKIQAQILCFNIGSDLKKERYRTNTRSYHWVHASDNVVGQNVQQIFKEIDLNGKDYLLMHLPQQENQTLLLVNTLENNTSFGPHTLSTYFNPANLTQKNALTWMKNILFNGLNNSIQNETSEKFIPLPKNIINPPEATGWLKNIPSSFYISSRLKKVNKMFLSPQKQKD